MEGESRKITVCSCLFRLTKEMSVKHRPPLLPVHVIVVVNLQGPSSISWREKSGCDRLAVLIGLGNSFSELNWLDSQTSWHQSVALSEISLVTVKVASRYYLIARLTWQPVLERSCLTITECCLCNELMHRLTVSSTLVRSLRGLKDWPTPHWNSQKS